MSFEVPDLPLVLERFFPSGKRPQIAPFARFWVLFARIEPVLTGGEFAYHNLN